MGFWIGPTRPHSVNGERMVTEETAARPRINWLNLVFLLGTLLVAAVGTPWYLWR